MIYFISVSVIWEIHVASGEKAMWQDGAIAVTIDGVIQEVKYMLLSYDKGNHFFYLHHRLNRRLKLVSNLTDPQDILKLPASDIATVSMMNKRKKK